MLSEFISSLEVAVKENPNVRTVYFHNFSRFDGIILLRYYTELGDKYHVNTLMRNHKLVELRVSKMSPLPFQRLLHLAP